MNMAESYYDKFSRVYDLLSPDWYYRKPRKFAIQALALGERQTVLNLPCGTGQNFRYFQQYLNGSGIIVGVDLSSGMLQKPVGKLRPMVGITSAFSKTMPPRSTKVGSRTILAKESSSTLSSVTSGYSDSPNGGMSSITFFPSYGPAEGLSSWTGTSRSLVCAPSSLNGLVAAKCTDRRWRHPWFI